MGLPNKQVGWSNESNLLHTILKLLYSLEKVIYKSMSSISFSTITGSPSDNIPLNTSLNNIPRVVSISLQDLGLTSFDEVTNAIVAAWIASLAIEIADNELYHFEINDTFIPPVIAYNFDVESSDWDSTGITDKISFESQLGVTTTEFLKTGNNIKAFIDSGSYGKSWLSFRNIVSVNYITIDGLTTLGLTNNQIVTFNPTIALPNSLTTLTLTDNQIVTFNPTIALPNSLTALSLTDNQIVTFNPTIALPNSLTTLTLNANQIVTFNPTIALPNSLTALSLDNNQIVTFNPTIALPNSLTTLTLNANQIVTFNPTIALPNSLTALTLNANQIVTFNPTIALPNSLTALSLDNNQMTTQGYTNSEVWANNQPTFTLNCDVFTSGNVNSISGTNLETILISKNCTVIS